MRLAGLAGSVGLFRRPAAAVEGSPHGGLGQADSTAGSRILSWGLCSTAWEVQCMQGLPRSAQAITSSATETHVARSSEGPAERVGELLLDAARLAPCRFVVIGPTIMEATADLRVGQAQVRVSPRPGGGGPLLTLAAPDKSFEVHVDASAVAEATLGVSETTGKGVLRLLSAEKRLLLTVIPVGEDAQTHFDVLFGRWGASVRFQD
uniref:Uncharacterized protein n=1 Tax=Alexandrium monilatum TaxID=311494 RepID=A0A7S4V3J1_9DINO